MKSNVSLICIFYYLILGVQIEKSYQDAQTILAEDAMTIGGSATANDSISNSYSLLRTYCPVCGLGNLTTTCENVHLCTSECGQVKSISYPNNYGNNHRCRWSIKAPDTFYVNMSIVDFDIPSANNASKLGTCIFDYLTLIDGYTGKRLGCYCNENLPPPFIISPWNELIIQFDTNSETTGRGFYFQYEFKKLELTQQIQEQLKPPPDSNGNRSLEISSMASKNIGLITRIYGESSVGESGSIACFYGWQYYRGSCYKAYNEIEPLQWYDAESKCNNHGLGLDGHLVSILDKDEMLVIHYLLTNVWKSSRYKEYYIGLFDASREGVYRWSDNNPMSYTDWELKPMLLEDETPAQPDGGAYEDCTIIRYNSFSRTSNWHDVPCSLGKHHHSHLDRGSQTALKSYYVSSYICKTDSMSIASRSKFRRPLFTPTVEFNGLLHNMPLAAKTKALANAIIRSATTTTTVAPGLDPSTAIIPPMITNRLLLEQLLLANLSGSTGMIRDTYLKDPTHVTLLNENRYFVCDNLEIISAVLKCDGVGNCRDSSDEVHGCTEECLDWQFKCANGRCIPIGRYCDFTDDCGDGSDELRCERHRCKLNEFRCQNSQCIPSPQRCDLQTDCVDGSDEGKLCTIGSNCNSASTFQCYNGNCIPQYAVCDFQIDCPGKFHEDEDNCDIVLKNRALDFKFYSTASSNYPPSPIVPDQPNDQDMANGWIKQNFFKCTSGNIIDSTLKCLYEFDRYGYQIGCRDVSHLVDCSDFNCPKDYVKCPGSYCIPWRYICDGKWDCIMGDDEVGCARYVCPGQYKCANQTSCILLAQLCDGQRQCPMGDDEWFCDLQCPSYCNCIGQYVDCRGANLTHLPSNYISKSVRKLDLSYNRLGPNLSNSDFSSYHDLGELILHHNEIKVLIPRKFHQLRNLYKLDLSNNQIHSVKRGAFAGLRRVTQLLLESNPELDILEPEAFLGLSSLQMLNISSSRIMALRKYTFDGLTSLRHLFLRSNMIMEIEDGAFRSLNSLVSLDMRGNEIRYFTKVIFSDLKSLRNLSTDSFKFCCLMKEQISAERCLPQPDAISDCEDLLSSLSQRACIWVAGFVALFGNLIVISWRLCGGQKSAREEDQVNSKLLLSLGFSDILTGIFLIIIAFVDIWYRGNYIENADNWRESNLCNLCGFISTVSSEASVFTLVSIAYNRYSEICRTFDSPYKFTPVRANRLIAVSWCIALSIATLMSLLMPYFRSQLYARSGVCLAFHITNEQAAGWLYCIVFGILVVNLVAFIFIVTCYTKIYLEISQRQRPNQPSPAASEQRPNNSLKIALILITNFVACFPTIMLRLITLAGVPLPAAVYSWTAVLVLPMNSAINPMIYTIPSIHNQIRMFVRNHRAAHYTYNRRQRANVRPS